MELESTDNLYLICDEFMKTTGECPMIQMDNIRIQANIPDEWFVSRYGTWYLPEGCRVRIPPNSPDLNQVIEHCVGVIKWAVTEALYEASARRTVFSRHSLQSIVKQQFTKFAQGQLFQGGVVKNTNKMPDVWRSVSMDVGESFVDHKGKTHYGTGGDWARAGDR